jgi:hypothetical protein
MVSPTVHQDLSHVRFADQLLSGVEVSKQISSCCETKSVPSSVHTPCFLWNEAFHLS